MKLKGLLSRKRHHYVTDSTMTSLSTNPVASPLAELDTEHMVCRLSPLDGALVIDCDDVHNDVTSSTVEGQDQSNDVVIDNTDNNNNSVNNVTEAMANVQQSVSETEHEQQQHTESSVPASVVMATGSKPAKRRPGRPPGKSKKPRLVVPPLQATNSSLPHPTSSSPSFSTALSLRAFFECGGRDYDQYVQLTKCLQANEPLTLRAFFDSGGRDYNQFLELTKTIQRQRSAHLDRPAPQMTSPPVMMTPMLLTPPPSAGATPLVGPVRLTQSAPAHLPFDWHALHQQQQQQVSLDIARLCATDAESAAVAYTLASLHTATSPSPLHHVTTPPPIQFNAASSRTTQNASSHHVFDSTVIDSPESLTDDVTQPIDYSTSFSDFDLEPLDLSVTGKKPMTSSDSLTNDVISKTVDVRWSAISVDDVADYIASIPDCKQYAEVFRRQRIDGSTLPLLTEHHLTTSMNICLGPAIKLHQAIRRLVTSMH